MPLVVQKYGGTVLRDPGVRRLAVTEIQRAREAGIDVVVVVSAMGRAPDPYATDTLLDLARETCMVDPLLDGTLARNLDILLSAGEVAAAGLIALHLCSAGIPAVAVTAARAGLITSSEFGRARILRIEPAELLDALRQGRTPVVAGFQGVTEAGELTTLGRGGSDTTAVALGAALDADLVEIVKDVEGVMTADPALVGSASLLEVLSHDDLIALSGMGSRVVQPRAVELGRLHEVPIRVRKLGHKGGTYVMPGKLAFEINGDLSAVALAHQDGIALLSLSTDSDGVASLRRLLGVPDLAGRLQCLAMTAAGATACLREEDLPAVTQQVRAHPTLRVEVRPHCAMVSIVGPAGSAASELMAAALTDLESVRVPVLHAQGSQGVSVVVDSADLRRALSQLHTMLRLDARPATADPLPSWAHADRLVG